MRTTGSRPFRKMLGTLPLALLAVSGCARTLPFAPRRDVEAHKCELVQTVMHQPSPSLAAQQIVSEGRAGQVPVVVYVRHPDQSMLERFFQGEPQCGDPTFRVVQENVVDAVVVYLQEVQGGYAYDARRASPEQLTAEAGKPQGTLKRRGASWVSVN
ncbi:hypothetical protein DRW03_34080 [Corallococcus sp. H22C18031201]|uniref:hypothetical protein n=1 Tax=Citreicoccus inhibens TaxID=2849499 RepID=UPI000E722CE3|nr:hypothetical protein [Citreicoccus inhibens]MBU8899198.1 hypothetical protein [Citreicoccus inhibens]RJS15269.1 hypothetical protein DRW03_34080 [Corallococcus sp. H22C18031201]